MHHTWITCLAPNPNAALRLFCLPYAGGSSVIFHRWPQELSAAIEVCAVKLPGRESRFAESPFARMTPLVQALAEGLAPYLDRPFALFGHSLGGLVGYELVHELQRQQRPAPVHLIVSASRAPHLPPRRSPMHDLPTETFIDRLRDYAGTPEQVLDNRDLMELLLPVLRADFAISETYQSTAETPITCPITAFCSSQDNVVYAEDVQAWQPYTRNTFALHTMPGNHFFINSARSELTAKIGQMLTAYVPGGTGP